MAGVLHLLPYYIFIYFPRSKRNWAFILLFIIYYIIGLYREEIPTTSFVLGTSYNIS